MEKAKVMDLKRALAIAEICKASERKKADLLLDRSVIEAVAVIWADHRWSEVDIGDKFGVGFSTAAYTWASHARRISRLSPKAWELIDETISPYTLSELADLEPDDQVEELKRLLGAHAPDAVLVEPT